jgi:hypothetical protein
MSITYRNLTYSNKLYIIFKINDRDYDNKDNGRFMRHD